MKNLLKLTLIAMIAISFSNCKKDKKNEPEPEPAPVVPVAGSIKIAFEAMVGDSELVFSTSTYTNQIGNTFNVTLFQYYVSNIKLTKMDGSVWAESNSYHLVDHSNMTSTMLSLTNVPLGDYKAIEYVIGVDSAKNNSGAQTGALDPSNGMFWSWSTGYIMAKMEGTSPQSPAVGQNLKFHVGGFTGVNNTIKKVTPTFSGAIANVTSATTPTIHISGNLLEWFKTPTAIDFTTTNTVHMPGTSAKTIADNYADMFTVEHIHN